MKTAFVNQSAPSMVADSWMNSRGERVQVTERGLRVTPVASSSTRATGTNGLADEVQAELKKHPGVVAVVDEARGRVQLFMKPKPYFQKS